MHGEGPDVTPVKVLNCDTISQVGLFCFRSEGLQDTNILNKFIFYVLFFIYIYNVILCYMYILLYILYFIYIIYISWKNKDK